jgi:hypothetical protein
MTQPSDYFDRAKALQAMILEAMDDLKQLRADAIEELITEGTPKEKAKDIRADLAEVFSVAKIAAKGDMEERKQAEKLARRKRIAHQCGVQLDLLHPGPNHTASEIERRSEEMGQELGKTFGKLQSELVGPLVEKIHDRLIEAGMQHEGGNQYRVPAEHPIARDGLTTTVTVDYNTEEDEDDDLRAQHTSEPATVHVGGMSDEDHRALTDIPAFLRRT